MRIGIVLFLILGLVGNNPSVWAQDKTPKYSNEFLSIGVGARAMSMSNAVVASSADGSSGYWNPAGLPHISSDYNASFMHSIYFAGIANYDFLQFSVKVDDVSRFGVAAIRFGVDDIPDTRFLYDANGAINYDNIRFFSAADYAFLFSYGRKITAVDGLSVGGSVKIVYRHVGQFADAWGFGLDAAAQYRKGKWFAGVMIKDITTTFNAWSHNSSLVADVYSQTGNVIPQTTIEITLPSIIIGGARAFDIGKDFGLLFETDLFVTTDGKRNTLIKSNSVSADLGLGIEADYKELVYLRAGTGQFQQIKQFDGSEKTTQRPSFGVGVVINKILLIDYTFSNIGDVAESPYSHVFSLEVNLNRKQ